MPNTSVPRPPMPQATLAIVSSRLSVAYPSAGALSTTTVTTRKNAAVTCRKSSQSYTRADPSWRAGRMRLGGDAEHDRADQPGAPQARAAALQLQHGARPVL